MADFKVGDVVQLKSGSVPMTVTEVDMADDKVQCTWFPDGLHSEGGWFPSGALEPMKRRD